MLVERPAAADTVRQVASGDCGDHLVELRRAARGRRPVRRGTAPPAGPTAPAWPGPAAAFARPTAVGVPEPSCAAAHPSTSATTREDGRHEEASLLRLHQVRCPRLHQVRGRPRRSRCCARRHRWSSAVDRPVGRGVAEPPGGPHRGGPGVGRVGDGQLGGDEDRLAGALGDLGGRLGEAGVLALVVGDDPLEAVVGVERPAPHHRGLVRLDAEARGGSPRRRRGAPAISSSTCGIVSRVSPPARSTGLLRLHRGGSSSSIASCRSAGSGERRASCG